MTSCRPTQPGILTIDTADLGTLDLTADGLCATSISIGFPADRPVDRARALGNGVLDDTGFGGGRAITVGLRLNPYSGFDHQEMVDRVRRYLPASKRPRLTWSMMNTPTEVRSTVVRCVDAPLPVEGRFPILAMSFLAAGYALDGTARSAVLRRGSGVEEGRDYGPPTFPQDAVGPYYDNTSGNVGRQYPAQTPAGVKLLTNGGTIPANWTATIFAGTGAVVDPEITLGGIDITFDENGGLTIPAGQSLTLSTFERSALSNNDPSTPVYDRVNFLDWEWDDLRLPPGDTLARFDHSGASTDALASFEWRDAYL